MLSFFRPNSIPDFAPFYVSGRNYQPEEGVPFIQQNDSHWFVKIYLPDVAEEDFHVSVKEDEMLFTWKDFKQIKHRGRIYESSEDHEKSIQIPSGIKQDDIETKFKDSFAIVSIPKPKPKLENNTKELCSKNSGTLMKVKVPEGGDETLDVSVDGNQLVVKFETRVKKESGSEDNKKVSTSHTRIQRRIPIPEGVDASQIDTCCENGELIVRLSQSLLENNRDELEMENGAETQHETEMETDGETQQTQTEGEEQ